MFEMNQNDGLPDAMALSQALLQDAQQVESKQALTADEDDITETSIGTTDSDFAAAMGIRAESDFDDDDDGGVFEDDDEIDDDDDYDDDLDDDDFDDDDDDDDDFDADDDDFD